MVKFEALGHMWEYQEPVPSQEDPLAMRGYLLHVPSQRGFLVTEDIGPHDTDILQNVLDWLSKERV